MDDEIVARGRHVARLRLEVALDTASTTELFVAADDLDQVAAGRERNSPCERVLHACAALVRLEAQLRPDAPNPPASDGR